MKTNTTLDLSLLVVRIITGLVVAAHGAQKLLGWFGGYGFEGTMGFFTGDTTRESLNSNLYI